MPILALAQAMASIWQGVSLHTTGDCTKGSPRF